MGVLDKAHSKMEYAKMITTTTCKIRLRIVGNISGFLVCLIAWFSDR